MPPQGRSDACRVRLARRVGSSSTGSGSPCSCLPASCCWLAAHRAQIPIYQSVARLLVEEDVPKVLNVDDFVSAGARNLEQFNTHLKALHSRAMLQKAIEAKRLDKNPRFLPGRPRSPDDLAEAALGFVRIEPVPRSRLIDVVVEHPDPALAADLATASADQYIAQNLSRRMESSMQAFNWLRRQAEEYRAKIESGRMALHEYRKETQTISLEEHQDIVVGSSRRSMWISPRPKRNAWRPKGMESGAEGAAGGQPLSEIASIAADDLVKQTRRRSSASRPSGVLRTRYREQHPSSLRRCTS